VFGFVGIRNGREFAYENGSFLKKENASVFSLEAFQMRALIRSYDSAAKHFYTII